MERIFKSALVLLAFFSLCQPVARAADAPTQPAIHLICSSAPENGAVWGASVDSADSDPSTVTVTIGVELDGRPTFIWADVVGPMMVHFGGFSVSDNSGQSFSITGMDAHVDAKTDSIFGQISEDMTCRSVSAP